MSRDKNTIYLPNWIHPLAALLTIASAAIAFWAFVARPFTSLSAEVQALSTELRLERQAHSTIATDSSVSSDLTGSTVAASGGTATTVNGDGVVGGSATDSVVASGGSTVTSQRTGGAPAFSGLQAGGDLSIGLAERHPSYARHPSLGSASLKAAPLHDTGIPSFVCSVPHGTRLVALDFADDPRLEREYFYVEVAEGRHRGTRGWISTSNFSMGSDAVDILAARAEETSSRPAPQRVEESALIAAFPPELAQVSAARSKDVARHSVQEWMAQNLLGKSLVVEFTCDGDRVGVAPTPLNTHSVSMRPKRASAKPFLTATDAGFEVRLNPFRFTSKEFEWENVDLDFVQRVRQLANGEPFKMAIHVRSLTVKFERDDINRYDKGPPYLLVQCVTGPFEFVE